MVVAVLIITAVLRASALLPSLCTASALSKRRTVETVPSVLPTPYIEPYISAICVDILLSSWLSVGFVGTVLLSLLYQYNGGMVHTTNKKTGRYSPRPDCFGRVREPSPPQYLQIDHLPVSSSPCIASIADLCSSSTLRYKGHHLLPASA